MRCTYTIHNSLYSKLWYKIISFYMYLTLLIKLILVSKEQENEKGKGERESEGLLPFYL